MDIPLRERLAVELAILLINGTVQTGLLDETEAIAYFDSLVDGLSLRSTAELQAMRDRLYIPLGNEVTNSRKKE